MADDKDPYNDEYQFTDLDVIGPEPVEENQDLAEEASSEKEIKSNELNHVKRNAIIAIGALFLLLISYKLLSNYILAKKMEPKQVAAIIPVVVPQAPVAPAVVQAQPIIPVEEPKLAQRISTLEVSQQSMHSDVESASSQLAGMNNNVTTLTAQIAQLSQIVTALSAKVDAQSQEIERLVIKNKPKVAPRAVRKKNYFLKYNIQAVIPGRAWLIAPNGTTLTVREGTVIPGYGMVKLIDPTQGRVSTSSGQVIKFGQEDS